MWLRSAYLSCSSRVMPRRFATFSAVCAIIKPAIGSVSAAKRESCSVGDCPKPKPWRTPYIEYGAWLMFSMPPASTVVASPSRIICAPLTTAWMPEPHKRFTVNAPFSLGTPAFKPTWRAP
jgi:hypothetical protein